MMTQAAITASMNAQHVPGLSLAVLQANQVVHTATYGVLARGQPQSVTPTTLFQACSISKAVTAVAALRLVEAGQLELDSDVNPYLHTWQVPANADWQPRVTLRQLLSHTAGVTVPWFPGYHREQQIPTLLQVLQGDRPANTPGPRVNVLPGSRYRYSGGGYCVLQQLLCDVTGQPFAELMRDLVLTPADMTHSTFAQPLPSERWAHASTGHRADGSPLAGQWHVYPEQAAAGLWTTALDLANFARQVQLAQAGQPNTLLSYELAQTMLTPQVSCGNGATMGLGIWLAGSPTTGRFGHPGDNEGFACRWLSTRSGGHGVVIMTNSDSGWILIEEILKAVDREYGWTPPGEDEATFPKLIALPLAAYTGDYYLPDGATLTITAAADELYLLTGDQQPLRLIAATDHRFVVEALDSDLVFLVCRSGEVYALAWQQDGLEQVAHKQVASSPGDKLPGE